MAKRLTDTEKWKDDWYIQLSNDYKIVWQWLLDSCSHAGICKRSMGLLNLMCKTDISESQMIEKLEGRVLVVGNSWFIPKFIKFQYTTLLSNKPVIISTVKDLFSMNCVSLIPESYGNDYIIISKSFENHYQMIKDKDKDKIKDKDTPKGGVGENNGKPLKGVKIENGKVFFKDGSFQELGNDQRFLLKEGQLTAQSVVKGFIY